MSPKSLKISPLKLFFSMFLLCLGGLLCFVFQLTDLFFYHIWSAVKPFYSIFQFSYNFCLAFFLYFLSLLKLSLCSLTFFLLLFINSLEQNEWFMKYSLAGSFFLSPFYLALFLRFCLNLLNWTYVPLFSFNQIFCFHVLGISAFLSVLKQ